MSRKIDWECEGFIDSFEDNILILEEYQWNPSKRE